MLLSRAMITAHDLTIGRQRKTLDTPYILRIAFIVSGLISLQASIFDL
jgi:hypothetical protein